MARTIKEIKNIMGAQYISNPTIREMYGITGNVTFDQVFSVVSVESILFYVVAAISYTIEIMFEQLKNDVDEKIAQGIVATVPWYHKIATEFQYGDKLVFDENTQTYRYQLIDESKQIIKYAAVTDVGNGVRMLVAKDNNGIPESLNAQELAAFKDYISYVKIAGVYVSISSTEADSIQIEVSVQIDPLVLNNEGKLIDGGSSPVVEAINQYLANIVYGGTFNKTKLVDAIQAAPGVVDVLLKTVKAKGADDVDYQTVSGNNYTAVSGCFISNNLNTSIDYVQEL